MQRIIVADTETTGLTPPIHICEVAWCEIDDEFEILSEFNTLVNPGVRIPCDASGLSGIRDEDVLDSPRIEDIKFPDGEIILIGHNVAYDRPLLEPWMTVEDDICTMILARRLLPDAPSHALRALSCYCKLPRQLSHRAYGDVRDCLGLLEFMSREFQMSLQDLYTFCHTPQVLKIMPWGKHKGTRMQDLPYSYVTWIANSAGNLDRDMKHTLKELWGLDVTQGGRQ